MSAMASQITGASSVCSTVHLCADQRNYQSFPSLAFLRGIRRWPVDSPHKRKMFPFDESPWNNSGFLLPANQMPYLKISPVSIVNFVQNIYHMIHWNRNVAIFVIILRHFYHWQFRKLSKRQLLVQSRTKISSKWRYSFRYNGIALYDG